jgi:hypothetical protein
MLVNFDRLTGKRRCNHARDVRRAAVAMAAAALFGGASKKGRRPCGRPSRYATPGGVSKEIQGVRITFHFKCIIGAIVGHDSTAYLQN